MILQYTIDTVGSWDPKHQIKVLQNLKDKDALVNNYRQAATENLQGMALCNQRIAQLESSERELKRTIVELYDAWRCEEDTISDEANKVVSQVINPPRKKT